MSGERINELKRRLIGTAGPEEQGEKGLEGNEQSIKGMWDSIKRHKIEIGVFSN